MTMLIHGKEIITPNNEEAELAKQTSRALATGLAKGTVALHVSGTSEELTLPSSVVRVLLQVLTEFGQGNAVTVTPIQTELSTQQAADLLNVSRQYLVKLLDEGAIPSRKVGVHRRLLLTDVLAYKQQMYAKQLQGMQELTALSQELGLYDDETR